MAASSTLPQHNISRKSQIGKAGVLTLSGFGIKVRMQRGHLEIEDGVGLERRTIRLPRVGHGLKRLIVIGSDGFVSLSALEWLTQQDASFVMLERDGKISCVTGPVRPSEAKLRRAQALAAGSGLGLEIARSLIDAKLQGQQQVLRERLNCQGAADVISDFRSKLVSADTFDAIRIVEANAAARYFREWRDIPVTWPRADISKDPGSLAICGKQAVALDWRAAFGCDSCPRRLKLLLCPTSGRNQIIRLGVRFGPRLRRGFAYGYCQPGLACPGRARTYPPCG